MNKILFITLGTCLIFLDFVIYVIPIFLFCILSIISLFVLFFPRNLYYFYSSILKNNYVGPNLKVLFIVFSPVAIALYFPICLFLAIFYASYVIPYALIRRYYDGLYDEIEFYKISSIMAVAHFIFHYGSREIKSDIESQTKPISSSPVTKPFKDTWKLVALTWYHFYYTLPQKIHNSKNYVGTYYDIQFLRILSSILFFPVYIICTIPLGIILCIIFYIPIASRVIVAFWNKYSKLNGRMKILMLLPTILLTIISPAMVTVGETVGMTGVWWISILAMWAVADDGFQRGLDVVWWVLCGILLFVTEAASL